MLIVNRRATTVRPDSSSPQQCCNDAPPLHLPPVPNTNRTQMACSSAMVSSLEPSHPPCTPSIPQWGSNFTLHPLHPSMGVQFHPAPPPSLNGGPISPCTPYSPQWGSNFTLYPLQPSMGVQFHPAPPTALNGGPISPCTPYSPQWGSNFTLHPLQPSMGVQFHPALLTRTRKTTETGQR